MVWRGCGGVCVALLACVVWVCVIVLGKEQREADSAHPAPLQTAASLAQTFGAMASGARDGGEGGWRKQNKIKN